jgi:hypothetical protein
MGEPYICTKCSEEKGREVRHYRGKIYEEHAEFAEGIKITEPVFKGDDGAVIGVNLPSLGKKQEPIDLSTDAIPEDVKPKKKVTITETTDGDIAEWNMKIDDFDENDFEEGTEYKRFDVKPPNDGLLSRFRNRLKEWWNK